MEITTIAPMMYARVDERVVSPSGGLFLALSPVALYGHAPSTIPLHSRVVAYLSVVSSTVFSLSIICMRSVFTFRLIPSRREQSQLVHRLVNAFVSQSHFCR